MINFIPDENTLGPITQFVEEGVFPLIVVGDSFIARCPECLTSFAFDFGLTNVCPNCGLRIGDVEFEPNG